MKTREAFCANCQELKDHTVTIDLNGDYSFECPCGRFFKLVGSLDKKGISQALEAHKAANEGQLTVEAIEAVNEEKLANI